MKYYTLLQYKMLLKIVAKLMTFLIAVAPDPSLNCSSTNNDTSNCNRTSKATLNYNSTNKATLQLY